MDISSWAPEILKMVSFTVSMLFSRFVKAHITIIADTLISGHILNIIIVDVVSVSMSPHRFITKHTKVFHDHDVYQGISKACTSLIELWLSLSQYPLAWL